MSTPAWKKKARLEQQAKEKQDRKYQKLLASVKQAKKEFKDYVQPKTYRRTPSEIASLPSKDSVLGSTAKREPNVYSGDYVVGIATMHKSNLVPVGRGVKPEIYATMRR